MADKLDWENLKTLRALARSGTVRSAASELGVHHATVSRRIEQLEASLGVRLFDRRPDGLFVTPAAEELVHVANHFANRLGESTRRIEGKDSELKGKVVVTMASPMAEMIMADRLPDFVDRYPHLDLHIVSTFDVLDLSRHEADIAVRLDNEPPLSLVGKRIATLKLCAYASRDYVAHHGGSKGMRDARWIGWGTEVDPFSKWVDQTPYPNCQVWGQFDDMGMQIACAKAGLGMVIVPCAIGDKHADLVRLGNGEPFAFRDVWLLTHNDLRNSARVRVVMDFIEQGLRDQRHLIEGQGLTVPE